MGPTAVAITSIRRRQTTCGYTQWPTAVANFHPPPADNLWQYPMANHSRSEPPSAVSGAVDDVAVGPEFCFPHPVDLTITKKAFSASGGDFTVTDVAGDVVFRVKGVYLSYRSRRVLADASGNPLITMQRKILSNHSRWKVFRGDSSDPRDLLFSAKRSSLFQFKTKLHVFTAANTGEKDCDFKVKGDFFQNSATVFRGGEESPSSAIIIAQMRKKCTVKNALLGKDTFAVTVSPNVDHAFIVALIIILREINAPAGGGQNNDIGGGGIGGGGGCGGS